MFHIAGVVISNCNMRGNMTENAELFLRTWVHMQLPHGGPFPDNPGGSKVLTNLVAFK